MTQPIGMLSLPNDALGLIAKFLPVEDVISFSRVSRVVSLILNNVEVRLRITSFKITLANDLSIRVEALRGPNGFNGLIHVATEKLPAEKGALLKQRLDLMDNLLTDRFCYFYNDGESKYQELKIAMFAIDDCNNPCFIKSKGNLTSAFKEFKLVENQFSALVKEEHELNLEVKALTDRLNVLRGPNGFDGLINQAHGKMQETKNAEDEQKFTELLKELNEIAVFGDNGKLVSGKLHVLTMRSEVLQGVAFNGLVHQKYIERQYAEIEFRQASEVFSSNAQTCFPYGDAITPPVAMLLPEVYATIDSQPFDDAKAELISLTNELGKLVIFGENGQFIGGLLHKLRQ
ncbi:MAG: F-box protein [Rhabdochlamydiaceae bacterium]